MVPKSLRTWFVVHFILDVTFAIPLLVAPGFTLTLFGWETIDPMATRLVGAALMGIGLESFLGRNAGAEAYRAMLNLKIIWASSASFGIATSMLIDGGPWVGWLILGIFVVFWGIWVYYRFRLGSAGR